MAAAPPLPAAAQRINGARFLEPEENSSGHVVLASYPRSGNSLMRALLEQATGLVTGSDTRPDRTLSRKLMEGGLVGEVLGSFILDRELGVKRVVGDLHRARVGRGARRGHAS